MQHSLLALLIFIVLIIIICHVVVSCCNYQNPEEDNWTRENSIWQSTRCNGIEAFEQQSLQNGLPVTWEKTGLDNSKYANPSQFDKVTKPKFDHLDFLGDTVFNYKCCPTAYSNSQGCACITPEQNLQLKSRFGNNLPYDPTGV